MIATFCVVSGCVKIRKSIRRNLQKIYEKHLWQNIGVVGEHELLWWSDHSLGRKCQLVSQKFNSWLKQYYSKGALSFPTVFLLVWVLISFKFTGNLHPIIQPTVQSFLDCLCCYITSTSWDELFSHALISAKYQHSRHKLRDIGLVSYAFINNTVKSFEKETFDYFLF